jgi:serine/threonine-protein kinase
VDGDLVIAGKYHVVQLIAQGGMGAVYDAVNAKTGRRVALKLIQERALARGPAALRRFEREAKAAGAVESQHVVQVLDAGEDEASGMPFIAMEYLEGEDLRAVIARGPLRAELALAVATQVCLGLVKAHAADIIHRDLKPANLFVASSDDDRRIVKLLDFGIAKLLHDANDGQRLTKTGDLVGSPPYMSPEQLAAPHRVDHRTDLWALGVVLYEMLSGVTPTAHISGIGERVRAICLVPSLALDERVPDIRPDVAALVHRALALDPEERFASAAEMLEALRALQPRAIDLRGDDLELGCGSPVDRRAPASKRRTRSAGIVSLALLALIGAFVARDRLQSASKRAELASPARAPAAPNMTSAPGSTASETPTLARAAENAATAARPSGTSSTSTTLTSGSMPRSSTGGAARATRVNRTGREQL